MLQQMLFLTYATPANNRLLSQNRGYTRRPRARRVAQFSRPYRYPRDQIDLGY